MTTASQNHSMSSTERRRNSSIELDAVRAHEARHVRVLDVLGGGSPGDFGHRRAILWRRCRAMHAPRWSSRARECCSPARAAASARRSRERSPSAARELVLSGRRADAAARRWPASSAPRRCVVRPRRPRAPSSGWSPRPARSTCWSPTPACRAPARCRSSSPDEIDRVLEVNLRAPIALARRLAPGDGRARQRSARVRRLVRRARCRRPARARSTPRRSSACAGSRTCCARR